MFNHKLIAHITGTLLLIMTAAMLVPLAVSVATRDGAQYAIALSAVVMLLPALFLRNLWGRKASYTMGHRESFWVTSIIWLVVPLLGSVPFMLSGVLPRFADALFESISGFTTTGSSVIADLSEVPPSILVWRSMTQWIGGLGLILFIIAILKKLTAGSVQLYDAEFSGTMQRKLHPHIAKSVSLMWRIYLLLTVLQFVAMLVCGNGMLESLCLSLSTVSTGGFTTTAGGMAGYSQATLGVVTFFMFLSGVNIALVYHLITGKGRMLWRSEEFHIYVLIYLVAVLGSTAALTTAGNSWQSSLGYSLFHVASTASTCGFYLPNPVHWSVWVSAFTFALIVIGAMSGSTGGGIKIKRIMILTRYVHHYFLRMLHPNAVFTVKVDGETVKVDYINKVFAFVFLYIALIVVGGFLLTLGGLNIPNAVCMAAANISNLGPSPLLNNIGASVDYVALSLSGKCTLMVLMLAGRLEIFAILALLFPIYWKKS